MKRLAWLLSGGLLACSLVVLAQQKHMRAEQELLKLEQQWGDASVKPDLAFLDRILAEDYLFTSPWGEVLTKAQLLEGLRSGEDVVSSAVNHDMKVRVYGDAAVVNGHTTYIEKVKDVDISGEYRWTDTWIKKDGRWQCVADHGSRIGGMIAPPEQTAALKLRPQLEVLKKMLGDWTYEGENYATPIRPASKFTGKMSCRPFLNGSFIEVRGEELGAPWYEIDGYDPANKSFFWHGYDPTGHFNVATSTIGVNTITYSGTTHTEGKPYRTRGTYVYSADATTLVQKEEISLDGRTWLPSFEATFTKNKGS